MLAAFIVIMAALFDAHPLIARVVFTEAELSELGPKTVAIIKSLAILFNSCAAAFSLLAVLVIWTSLVSGCWWAFCGLLITMGAVSAFGVRCRRDHRQQDSGAEHRPYGLMRGQGYELCRRGPTLLPVERHARRRPAPIAPSRLRVPRSKDNHRARPGLVGASVYHRREAPH